MSLEKILPIDYQDYSNIIDKHIELILYYQTKHQIKFDCVIGKNKNGLLAATIIANNLNLDMGLVDVPLDLNEEMTRDDIYFPIKIKKSLDKNENINILLVDYIVHSGDTLNKIKVFIKNSYPNINIITYASFIRPQTKSLVDIYGIILDKHIQTPWERNLFTPQSYLDRLENSQFKTSLKDSLCIGISSESCKNEIKILLPNKTEKRWYMIFQDDEIINTSEISSYSIASLTFEEAKKKYKKIIDKKIKFIKEHGLTHFIEDNMQQALLLANKSPICHILYYTENNFYKLNVKEENYKNLFI